MRNKYGNKKVTVDGITFDSKKEYKRWCELCLLEKAGKITNLQRQVKFVLLPTQYEKCLERDRKGNYKKGAVIEREAYYKADFVYIDATGRQVVEDAKGVRTTEYVLKRKMMLHFHGIRIKEV